MYCAMVATVTWISSFPWIILGFFSACKILEKWSFEHNVLDNVHNVQFSWFFSLQWLFSDILFSHTYANRLNFKHCMNVLHMHLHIMFSSQCKQNKIVYCDILHVIIQGCQQSGVAQSGKSRKKKYFSKVSQKVRKCQGIWKKSIRFVQDRYMSNGRCFNPG